LSDHNFTAYERSFIQPVVHRSILSAYDAGYDPAKIDSGSEAHQDITGSPDRAVANYDTAYASETEDRVFLLSMKELHDYVYRNMNQTYLATYSSHAVDQFDDGRRYRYTTPGTYWLRDAHGESSSAVRVASPSGSIDAYYPRYSRGV